MELRKNANNAWVEKSRKIEREKVKKPAPKITAEQGLWRDALCPFCEIAMGKCEGRTSKILFQDEVLLAFEDRSPSGYKHYLVVPVEHIKNINSLGGEAHASLVERMLKLGESLLQKDAPGAEKYRFGFHRPPYNSMSHLHLHCIAMPFRSWWGKFQYASLGCLGGWIAAEDVLRSLNSSNKT